MALISQSIKNLKGGVSQQPDILRFGNQGAVQINGWSSETEGLQKRPPSVFKKRIGAVGFLGKKPLIHLINRDAYEQYQVVLTGTGCKVFGLDGKEYTVRGFDVYGNCANPRDDMRLITVADYTFVVNRKQIIEMGDELTHPGYPKLTSRAIVNVRGGQYGRTLSITLNDDVSPIATYKIPNGSAPDHVNNTDAQFLADTLAEQINKSAGWKATSGAGWICLEPRDPTTQTISKITTKDGYADQLLNAFIYQIQTFNKLPLQCLDGYLVEITGEASRSGDNYWVRYDATGKVWKETVKPGIIKGFKNHTMPRALVRAADGNFDWTTLEWSERKSGDDDTNPLPSFVDSSINDVFFFRNRLGFLSGENVIMSRTSKHFNFFPPSVSALSDDDPIDVAVSHNRISILKYAVPFSEQLLLWSDQAQFVLTSQGVMSAKSIQLDLTTEFDVSDDARPFGIGRGVYYSAPRAAYSSVKRYYAVQDVSDVKSSEDVSSHIPSYIKNRVFAIHGSGTENFVSILTDTDESKVFIYKFLYMREELVQQSWSHWQFDKDSRVLAANCIGSYMHLIIEHSSGVTLSTIEFTANTVDFPHEPYRAYMDMKVSWPCTDYDEDLNESRVSLTAMYQGLPTKTASFYSLDSDGGLILHNPPVGGWSGDAWLRLNGDRRGVNFVVGKQYTFTYQFSKFLIKQTADDGSTSTEDIGRLQLRRAWVNYEDSGFFEINVSNGSQQYVYTMSGGLLGTGINLGTLSLGTGQRKFPVTGNALNQAVTITSETPNPLNIIGCGWEGSYVRRSQGV